MRNGKVPSPDEWAAPLELGKGGHRRRKRPVRVIAVTSGKGGVGKTNITANMACLLARMRNRVLVLDADVGLANIDVILGLTPTFNLCHVLAGEKTLKEVIVPGPGGFRILPSASGLQEMSDLSRGHKLTLIDEIRTLRDELDFMLIDTGAGISGNVMYFNMAAQEIIVVTSPEPTAITDAYAVIKVLNQRHAKERFRVLVNMVKNEEEAKEVFARLNQATSHFLNVTVAYLGHVVQDDHVPEAVRKQKPFVTLFPRSAAARCLRDLAEKIGREEPDHDTTGTLGFFWDAM
ncbi:MAG: MinD/ParA family protein [Syntrophales bacterium]|nr:MinD/ParA family protein [Syntrophales bacterium]